MGPARSSVGSSRSLRSSVSQPMARLREAQLVSIDHFAHELSSQLRSTAEQGATTVVITCSGLCKSIRDASLWTQACCEAMQAEVNPAMLCSLSRIAARGCRCAIACREPANKKPRPMGSDGRGQSGVNVPAEWNRLGQNSITRFSRNNPPDLRFDLPSRLPLGSTRRGTYGLGARSTGAVSFGRDKKSRRH